ncbi:MAG: sigma-70 family RNA polymerase sigma factor [Verrucomicrobiae bacterium]|nr:sigma-70 family RNA polymerase sigma factor [Verrucomicrobiae bacterium]
MKTPTTTTNRVYGNETTRPRLVRARLTPARRARTVREPAAAVTITDETVAPAIVPDESEPEAALIESSQGNMLQLYLREIGQVKLLTPAEELALAKRVKRGDKKAREQMITANLRLVVKIARGYEAFGVPLLDLINEGNIGLIKGVQRFDPSKGAKLSTYASWWIKQAIRRALSNQSKTIRLPVHVVEKLTHIRRAEVRLRETLDREPTDEEVADDLGYKLHRIRQYRDASRAPVSLDSPIDDDNATSVAEHVADTNAAAPFDELLSRNDTDLVQEVLATLDARESRILAMRFGLDNGKPKTLEEVGARLGVTRERIRQIQEQALEKMRVKIEKREQPVLALEA